MKKIWQLLMLIFLGLMLSGCNNHQLADENVWERVEQANGIVWGVKNDTRLFGYMDIKDGVVKGFDIDIAKAITKEILGSSDQAQFVEVVSKTRIPLLKNGNIDAIIATMTASAERKKVVDFSHVYFNAGQSLLVKKGSPIHSVKDLTAGTTVLSVKGSASTDNIRRLAPEANVLDLDSYAECFTALQSGQGEAMTTDSAILLGLSAENPDYVLVGGNFTEEPYGIAVNKGQKEFLGKINTALAKIRRTGKWKKIYQKWFGEILGNQEESK